MGRSPGTTWVYFEVRVAGKDRRFLLYRHEMSAIAQDVEILHELKD